MVRRHGRRPSRRRDLAVAPRSVRMERARGCGTRHRPGRTSGARVESGAVPARPRSAAPLLQGRAEPGRLVGACPHIVRSRALVVGCRAVAERHPRSHSRQAGGASRRNTAGGLEHRGWRLGGPHGALRRQRAGLDGSLAEVGAAERPQGLRGDSADHPRALGDPAPGPVPQPPTRDHRRRGRTMRAARGRR